MLGAFEVLFCVFKQKTAYEVRISDWSSDVCSSDLSSGKGLGLADMLVKQLRGTAATPASVGTDATMAADASTLIGSKRALALQAHPNPVAASAPDVRA